MRANRLLSSAILCLLLTATAFADRTLSDPEIVQILQQLTQQPRWAWIAAGTIQATHHKYQAARISDTAEIERMDFTSAITDYKNSTYKREVDPDLQKMVIDAIPANERYKLGNSFNMSTSETVKYDGDRFYWAISLISRSDTWPVEPGLDDNYMYKHFEMHKEWNRERIFAWDGQQYTTYSASGNQAIVDAAGRMPHPVNGPLTAGLIPWGTNVFSYANLTASNISATQTDWGTIEMSIGHTSGAVTEVVLDPDKAYAVTNATLTNQASKVTTYTCSNYELVGGQWVPMGVSIQRVDGPTNKLLASEEWTIDSVDASTPGPSNFEVPLAAHALVEYDSPVTTKPAQYTLSNAVDTDELLFGRLACAARQRKQRENCATAALRHIAASYGKTIPETALAALVADDGGTSLLNLKKLAQGSGLYSRAVKGDLGTLRDLRGATAILHLPGREHFVVLDRVEDGDVWLIDLAGDKFYYRKNVDFFPFDWPEGTALLLSDRPITGRFTELSDSSLSAITGGNDYTCTDLVQEYDIVGCIIGGGLCWGSYQYYWERYGCEYAGYGSCGYEKFIRFQESPCIDDPIYQCNLYGTWYYYYMRACN